jgi:hypothetical protein
MAASVVYQERSGQTGAREIGSGALRIPEGGFLKERLHTWRL